MAYPDSSDVTSGQSILASQYNNLRKDALYAYTELTTHASGSAPHTNWHVATIADADGTLADATAKINTIIDRLQQLGLVE